MRQQLRAYVVTLALCAIAGSAHAQGGAGTAHTNLTPEQEQAVTKGLASHPTQSAPSGYQGQVGSRPPDSMQAQAMPNNVSSDVPEAKNLFFVKLPDRILLLDPDTKMIAEIIVAPAETTGTAGNGRGTGSGSGTGR
jgi:hypothetical protein